MLTVLDPHHPHSLDFYAHTILSSIILVVVVVICARLLSSPIDNPSKSAQAHLVLPMSLVFGALAISLAIRSHK